MSKRELLASAAQVEPALEAAALFEENKRNAEEKKRQAAAREQRGPRAGNRPRREPGDHHRRHGDRGDSDGGDDGGGDGGDGGGASDHLVRDPVVWRELGITSMTGWRYTRDPNLNFPPAINIRGRNFRSRKMIEAWKREMMRRAIQARGNGA